MNTIGEKLAELRKSRGMTQEELASVIGVSAQSISKWENNTNMPDIMLLPVIAEIFGVSIDTLFGVENKKSNIIHLDDVVSSAYESLLHTMALGMYFDLGFNITIDEWEEDRSKALEEHPEYQTAIISEKAGAVYACSEIAFIYKSPKEGSVGLLESEEAVALLEAISCKTFRTILAYQLKNNTTHYTASSIAKKCDLNVLEAENTLELLVKYNLNVTHNVELDDEMVKVYCFNGYDKMMLVYTILLLAKRLANYHAAYYGYYGGRLN